MTSAGTVCRPAQASLHRGGPGRSSPLRGLRASPPPCRGQFRPVRRWLPRHRTPLQDARRSSRRSLRKGHRRASRRRSCRQGLLYRCVGWIARTVMCCRGWTMISAPFRASVRVASLTRNSPSTRQPIFPMGVSATGRIASLRRHRRIPYVRREAG